MTPFEPIRSPYRAAGCLPPSGRHADRASTGRRAKAPRARWVHRVQRRRAAAELRELLKELA